MFRINRNLSYFPVAAHITSIKYICITYAAIVILSKEQFIHALYLVQLCIYKNADLITMARYETCKTVVGTRVLIQQVSCFLDNFIDFIKTRVYDNIATKVQHFLHNIF